MIRIRSYFKQKLNGFFYIRFLGFLGRARAQVESIGKTLFEGDASPQHDYSMSPFGGVPQRPGQPPMQQGGPQHQYPPQNYGGYPHGNVPSPRANQPYPHTSGNQLNRYQNTPPRGPQGPPLQSQWGQQQAGTQQRQQMQPPQYGQRPGTQGGQGYGGQGPSGYGQQAQGQFGARPPPPQGLQQGGMNQQRPQGQQSPGGYQNPNPNTGRW